MRLSPGKEEGADLIFARRLSGGLSGQGASGGEAPWKDNASFLEGRRA
jgi:hypothetical protein